MTARVERRRNPYEAAYEAGRRDALTGKRRANRYDDRGHSAPYARAWERGYDEVAAELVAPNKESRDGDA